MITVVAQLAIPAGFFLELTKFTKKTAMRFGWLLF